MNIEERVESLERSMRRWRTACILMAVTLFGGLFLGATDHEPTQFDSILVKKSIVIQDGVGAGISMEAGPTLARLQVFANANNHAMVDLYATAPAGANDHGPPDAWIATIANDEQSPSTINLCTMGSSWQRPSIILRSRQRGAEKVFFKTPDSPQP